MATINTNTSPTVSTYTITATNPSSSQTVTYTLRVNITSKCLPVTVVPYLPGGYTNPQTFSYVELNNNQTHQITALDSTPITGCVNSYTFSPATAPLTSISNSALSVINTNITAGVYSYTVTATNSFNGQFLTFGYTITILSKCSPIGVVPTLPSGFVNP